MGTALSFNRDYNRTLAKQPRKSFGLSKYDVSKNLQQHPLTATLSIPDLVREQVPVQPETYPQTKSEENQSIAIVNHDNKMDNYNPIVVGRFVNYMNRHPSSNNYRSNRSIIERDGKRFLTEFKERLERRYVEVVDANDGRLRLFEVTDYIPSQTVRSLRANAQNSLIRSNSLQEYSRRPSSIKSNLVDFQGLNNRNKIDEEYHLYQSTVDANPNKTVTTISTIESKPTEDSLTVPAQYTTESYRSQIRPFRPHTPTVSDYNESQTISDSEHSDSSLASKKTLDQTQTDTNVYFDSTRSIDPFARVPKTSAQHLYTKRSTLNNYSEPNSGKNRIPSSSVSDYAPIPTSHQQNQYARRQNSSVYDN